jgi:hypothetical protein
MKNNNLIKFNLLFVIVLFANLAMTQTLKFNQIKLIGNTAEILQAGKAWKVESVISSSELIPPSGVKDNTYYSISKTIEINGNIVYISRSSRFTQLSSRYNSEATTGLPVGQVTELPFWLPEGTSLKAGSNVLYISVLEFDIVP